MARLKLNDKLQKEICDEIKAGTPMKHAAITHGISETTFYDWWGKGRDAKSGKFRNFYLAVEEAKSAAITLKSRVIHKASKDNWQAAAWWLERVDPDNFGRKDKLDFNGNVSANVNHDLSEVFDIDKQKELLNAKRERYKRDNE